MPNSRTIPPTAGILIAGLTAGIFVLDWLIPKGVAMGVLYAVPVGIACRTLPRGHTVLLGLTCTFLVFLDMFVSPDGDTTWMSLANRLLSTVVIWAVMGLAFQRRRASDIQSRSEGQLAGIVSSAMDAIITVDQDQRIVVFNPAAEQMFGYPAGKALGQTLDRFIPERFRAAHRDHIGQFGRTQVTSRRMGQLGRIWGVRADGEEFPLEASISQIEVGDQKLFTVILRDITWRVRAERLAAGQREFLEMLVTGAPLPEILARLCRVVEEQAPGLLCSVLLLEDTTLRLGAAPSLPEAYNRAIDGIEIGPNVGSCGTAAFRKETVIVPDIATDPLWKDFRELALEHGLRACWSTPILSPKGVVFGTLALYHRDPREPTPEERRLVEMATNMAGIAIGRRRGEESLRRERDFIAAVLDTASALVVVLDREGRVVRFNRACEHATGYRLEEVKGRRIWDFLLLPEEAEAVKRVFDDLWVKGIQNRHENYWVRRDGALRRIVWANTVLLNQQGHIEHVIATGLDVTELQQMQAQLQRTERLAELGTLASGMAHEIGTPMNVIQGRAEFLLQRTTEEPIRKGLETIVRQVERITKIMQQLLTFARRRPSEPKPLDLRRTIEDCLDVVQERLRRRRIEVRTIFDQSVPLVLADADQMSQVLLNLVLNAIHAMPQGGTLEMRLDKKGQQVELAVTDTGHGMPADVVKKIFDPFFTTKEVGEGTGLGLTVVHGILEEHAGSVDVESEPGRGTRFIIRLPIHGGKIE